jgi:hypothetical protein
MRKPALIVASLILMIVSSAPILQAQGNTEVYLVTMTPKGAGVEFDAPLKISERDGYNNQPSFAPDGGGVLFSSSDGKQTDIYFTNLKTGKTVRLTETGDSEYSPLVMPGGKEFSVIQLVLTEGPRKDAQPLLAFPLAGGSSRLLYENGKKVGYHAWIDADRAVLFILGNPNALEVVNVKTGESRKLTEEIGRSLYQGSGADTESAIFSQKGVIKKIDLRTNKIEEIVPLPSGNDLFGLTPDGSLITAVKTEIFRFRPGRDQEWTKIGDFSGLGIKSITRITVSRQGDRLAFVAGR